MTDKTKKAFNNAIASARMEGFSIGGVTNACKS